MSEGKAIDKANLELALSENNKKILEHTDTADSALRKDLNIISQYQRYVNTELDYGVFTIASGTSIVLITCNSVKSGNLSLDEDGYIILNANKKYILLLNLFNFPYDTGFILKDKEGNAITSATSGTSSTTTLYCETTEEIAVAVFSDTAAKITSNWCSIIVQEIGRSVTIDPVEYVNTQSGIEDTPVGHIISHMGTKAPKHYLICDGTEYTILDYPHLANHILDEFGSYNFFGGDGEATFAVPTIAANNNLSLIPTLSSNDGSIIASGISGSGFDSYKAFDGNTSSCWESLWGSSVVDDQYIGYSFGTNKAVTSYSITCATYNSNDVPTSPNTWEFQGSNDGDNWEVLDSQINQVFTFSGETKTYQIQNPKAYVMYRVVCSANNGHVYPKCIRIGELALYSSLEMSCIKYEPTYFYADTVQNNDPELEQIISQLGLILDDINGEVV